MRLLKYTISAILIVLALSNLLPIYAITISLINGIDGNEASYFIGKLIAYILMSIILVALGIRIIKSTNRAQKDNVIKDAA